MKSRTRRVAVMTTAFLAAGMVSLPVAEAATVSCGQVITQSTTLDADLGPCTNFGIIIAADNITLDLNGHQVFGTPERGDGAGILLRQVRGVTVKDGTVARFDGGVAIEGGGGNTVTGIRAQNNIGRSGTPSRGGADTRYGEGIAVEASVNNRILNNTTVENGPFAGIGLYEVPDSDHPFPPGPTSGNLVQGNLVENNVACRLGPFCDNDGIRIEPQAGPDNVVTGNTVRGNGLDGISVFGFASRNRVTNNVVEANGFNGAVPGDGIRVFGFENLIRENRSFANANDGVSVGRRSIAPPGSFPVPNGRDNRILSNTTGDNGHFDLYDANPNCDNNIWKANTFETAAPPCTTTP